MSKIDVKKLTGKVDNIDFLVTKAFVTGWDVQFNVGRGQSSSITHDSKSKIF